MSLLQALKLPPLAIPASTPPGADAADEGKLAVKGPQADKLTQAAAGWLKTHRQAEERIAALKRSVKARCADGPPALVQEVDKGLARLDGVLKAVDRRLADSLTRAGQAADDSARKAELKTARSLLAQYVGYVKTEPLVAHMDKNPFDVKTDLKALLAGGLADAAKAIG